MVPQCCVCADLTWRQRSSSSIGLLGSVLCRLTRGVEEDIQGLTLGDGDGQQHDSVGGSEGKPCKVVRSSGSKKNKKRHVERESSRKREYKEISRRRRNASRSPSGGWRATEYLAREAGQRRPVVASERPAAGRPDATGPAQSRAFSAGHKIARRRGGGRGASGCHGGLVVPSGQACDSFVSISSKVPKLSLWGGRAIAGAPPLQ